MTTVAVVGAGPGLGAALARRFGREGFSVAVISRTRENVDALAAALVADGIDARGYVADVRDRVALAGALAAAGRDLGPIEVLEYSPLPHRQFLRPVLETTADDVTAALEFSVFGPMAAVEQVLPGMRTLGRGTILFANGGSAARPNAQVAGTSIAFAGESAYATMLHSTLAPEGIHVGQLIIPGAIIPGELERLAGLLWDMHKTRDTFRVFAREM